MSGPRQHPSEATSRAVERSSGELSTLASQRMEEHLRWYRDLSAEERSQVGLVAQAGISQFIAWFHQEESHPPSAISIFANAPQELTRSVSLRQTLDLVRTVVDVVESRVESLAGPGDEQLLRESVLRFSREIAFAAAEVYAGAAEARGAWDARLEALVVDAVLRGEADDSMQSRASALGWGDVADVTFVVGSTPAGRAARSRPWTTCAGPSRQHGVEALAIVQRSRLIAILGGTREAARVVSVRRRLLRGRARSCSGPRCRTFRRRPLGPCGAERARGRRRLARRAARVRVRRRAARAGARRRPARARRILVDRIHRPLAGAVTPRCCRRPRPTSRPAVRSRPRARALFVHPNTVRYRLRTHLRVTGYDLTIAARGVDRAHRPGPGPRSPRGTTRGRGSTRQRRRRP